MTAEIEHLICEMCWPEHFPDQPWEGRDDDEERVSDGNPDVCCICRSETWGGTFVPHSRVDPKLLQCEGDHK